MSDIENKEKYLKFCEEFFNKKNLSIVDEIMDANVISHSPYPNQKTGAEGLKEAIMSFFVAFPDLNVSIEDMFAGEDKVVGRFKVSGTHKGDYMGIPATNKRFYYPEIAIVRFENGKIVEHWAVSDVLQMLQQIEAIDS